MNEINNDEYYSPENVVNMILPYIQKSGYKNIWCPFDKEESNFVKIFKENGFNVSYGHIETGQNFFEYDRPIGDIIVSNPPFSKRDLIFEKVFSWDIPFALVMNFNGLFDSRKRAKIFREHEVQLLVPYGRMKFIHKEKDTSKTSPNFQSVYVCNKLLDRQIVFDDTIF